MVLPFPGCMCQGGDVIMAPAALSSTGRHWRVRTYFVLKHLGPAILSTASAVPNTNGSQVFLSALTRPIVSLDCKHGCREGERRRGHRGSHGAFWVQEQDQQEDDHRSEWTALISL